MQRLFDGENVLISHAQNGIEMIKKLDVVEPDLVILDMKIEGKDSIDCLVELKKRNIKVIAHATYETNGEEERCLKAGYSGYISMPIGKRICYVKFEEPLISYAC